MPGQHGVTVRPTMLPGTAQSVCSGFLPFKYKKGKKRTNKNKKGQKLTNKNKENKKNKLITK